MALVSNPKSGDDVSVRQAIAKLGSTKLGGTSSPTFAGLTLTGLTVNSLVYPVVADDGTSTGALTSLGAATDGQLPIGDTDGVPVLATLTGTANEIDITNGAGTITIGLVNPLIVAKGGTGTTTLTDHGILLGSGTDAITPLGVASNGQLPIGSVGADPVLATLTGTTDHISVTNGAGSVTLDLATNTQTLLGSFNGIFLEKLDFTISEAAGTVTGSLEQDGGGDLIQRFSDGYTTLDCTPALTINLTAYVGTNAVPKVVFVYILQSAKTVMAASNSDWPATEHCKVARLILKSAATTGTDGGALGNQNINDYAVAPNGEGHLAHVEQRLRQEPAAYDEGVALTLKNAAGAGLTTGNSSTAVEIVTTAGKVYQLHRHTFPAFDMYTTATDDVHIVNQPTDEGGAYETTADLVTDVTHYVDGTAAGVVIGTNKYFNLVVWGIQNRSGEASHIMINLPTGQYTTSANAVADVDGISIFEIPSVFKDIGFLIARLTFRLIAGSQWTYIAQEDLRGKFPDIIAGVGITTTDHALLANLTAPADDHTQYLLADGTRSLAGAWDMGNQALTNVNIDSGVITGITDLAIADGGTGQSTAQAAIDALSAVSGATNEHVLTKDTGTGNAIWKATAAADAFTVKIDAGATAGYIGAANNDGVLRTDGSNITYADGGNFVTLTTAQGIQTSSTPQFTRLGLGVAAHASIPLHISDGSSVVNAALISSVYGLISAYNVAPGFSIVSAGPDVDDRAVFLGTRCDGTLASPTVPAVNDKVLSFLGAIYDGVDVEGTAAVDFFVDGAVSSNVAPQRISFSTSATNAAGRLERLTITSQGLIGINTASIPHAGIGSARLAIDGPASSAGITHATAGPHVQFTTHGDNYPVLQILNYAHDNINFNFDSYFDTANGWISSDAGSCFSIAKASDTLRFRWDVAAQGAAVTWNDGIVMNNTGAVQINGVFESVGVATLADGSTLKTSAAPTADAEIANKKYVDDNVGGANHAILDGSVHSDSVADAVTRGSIIYGNATPKWDELVVGAADTFLGSDGTDVSYRTAAQVMASLSGAATAAFDLNGQNLTNVGTLGAGNTTITGTLDVTGNIDPTSYETTRGGFKDEDLMGSDSATMVCSQQSIKAFAQFNDAGDIAGSHDYDLTDFTTDGTWRDWDLSGEVPAGAKEVTILYYIADDAVGSQWEVRENGNSNEYNTDGIVTQVANISVYGHFHCALDANRVIEYRATNLTWSSAFFTIRSWRF